MLRRAICTSPFGSTSPIAYNSTPPTSGPHYETLAAWGVHRPIRYEHLVHNLEDGGVVIYYQCADGCPELVEQLSAIVDPYFRTGRNVVMAPNDPAWTIGGSEPLHRDMGASIALAVAAAADARRGGRSRHPCLHRALRGHRPPPARIAGRRTSPRTMPVMAA